MTSAFLIGGRDSIAEAIVDEDDEPIELGWYDAQILTAAIPTEHLVSGNSGLAELVAAARRLAGEPPTA